jgi:hypothetical protein
MCTLAVLSEYQLESYSIMQCVCTPFKSKPEAFHSVNSAVSYYSALIANGN